MKAYIEVDERAVVVSLEEVSVRPSAAAAVAVCV